MDLIRTNSRTIGRFAAILPALLVVGPLARAQSPDDKIRAQTRPIFVDRGRAVFDLSRRKTLVVVSSLAKSSGPFVARLETRPIPQAMPDLALPAPDHVSKSVTPPIVLDHRTSHASPPLEKSFALMVRDGEPASPANYASVKARLCSVGERVQVYVDAADLGQVDPGLCKDLAATFDHFVQPLAERRFGSAADVDGDGRFTIFVSSRLDRLAGGRGKVDGFVRGADLDLSLGSPFGNRCDMMYLNASLRPGAHARSILAHEYTHAVIFSRKVVDRGGEGLQSGGEEEGWLDEGLAHLVEDLHGFSRTNIDYRVSAFLSSPERYRLVIADYFAADLFRSHGNRGGTYLFLRWVVDHYGEEVIDRLIRSDLRGIANLESATGRSFSDLYRDWSVSLYVDWFNAASSQDNPRLQPPLDPRGTKSDWQSAGPRITRLSVGGPSKTWELPGTSSRFFVIEKPDDAPCRVEVSAPAAADLQVTAVPLPDDLGLVDLEVRPVRSQGEVAAVRLFLTERGGTPVSLQGVGWEPLVPTSEGGVEGVSRASLDLARTIEVFGAPTLHAQSWVTSRPISVGPALQANGPTVFKVSGIDAKGRRVSAWAEWKGLGSPETEDPDDGGPAITRSLPSPLHR